MNLYGITILQSTLATTREIVWSVERHPTRKRRRQWRAVRREVERPAAFRMPDGRMAVHPEIYQRLLKDMKCRDTFTRP